MQLSSVIVVLASSMLPIPLIVCCQSVPDHVAPYQHVLIVLPGAFSVQYGPGEEPSVTYKLAEPYPARQTLAKIDSSLKAKSWRPLLEDPLNPGRPSAHVTGWDSFLGKNGKNVFQWLGPWGDEQGNEVWYRLTYVGKIDSIEEIPSGYLEVSAAYKSYSVSR